MQVRVGPANAVVKQLQPQRKVYVANTASHLLWIPTEARGPSLSSDPFRTLEHLHRKAWKASGVDALSSNMVPVTDQHSETVASFRQLAADPDNIHCVRA